MNRRIAVLFAAAAMVSMPGCWFTGSYWTGDRDDVVVDYDDTWTDSYGRPVSFERLDADLGGHQVALAQEAGTAYGGYATTLEIETIQDGSWVLFRLDVPADLYDPELDGAVTYSATADGVQLMGCTGDAPYEFDYDGYAREVEVQVSEGAEPGTRVVDFTATFDDGIAEQQVTGQIVIDTNAEIANPYGGGTTSTRSVQWEGLTGDLGDQGEYTVGSVRGEGYADGFYSQVELETTEVGQWILFRYTAYETNLFSAQVGDVIEGGELMGCTGDEPGSFDYDGYARDVRVEILPGATDAERIAHIEAVFDTEWGEQTFQGDVRYEVL